MIRRCLLLLATCLAMASPAQTLQRMWQQMPDSLCPLLTATMRTELADYYQMGAKAQVKNLMGGFTTLEKMSERELRVQTSESALIHLRLLPTANGDTVACVVRTLQGPAPESDICLYTTEWQQKERLTFPADELLCRPDTMTAMRFAELKAQAAPLLVSATWGDEPDELLLNVSWPFTYSAEKETLEAIRMQRKVKWNGKIFN